MLELPNQFILFDSEYTAWEGSQERRWTGPDERREIVQIAAIRVKGLGLVESGTFTKYVRPKINPILSPYFVELTGISQKVVEERGVDFHVALAEFKQWCGDLPVYSFGRDGEVVIENCVLADIESPFPARQFRNIRPLFKKHGVDEARFNSWNIVEAFGLKPMRRKHNALGDVQTLLDAVRCLSERVTQAENIAAGGYRTARIAR